LVDRFGGLQDAIVEAAKRAGLKPEDVHAEYLEKKPSAFMRLISQILDSNKDDDASAGDAFTRMATERRAVFARALGDVKRIGTGAAIQARCL
ncbi:signal peptide peptidase SppA, partial [Pseudomonas sp. GW460-C3]